MSAKNNDDPNFIPIASPVPGLEDPDPTNIPLVNDNNQVPLRRPNFRRRRPFHDLHHYPWWAFGPPVTVDQLKDWLTDYDDWYTNPLVSKSIQFNNNLMTDELESMVEGFNSMPQGIQPPDPAYQSYATNLSNQPIDVTGLVIPSLLKPDVSKQTNVQFPNDPYYVPGKTVKHGDILVQTVDIPQNQNWAGGIDYYEEGRLIAFTITCNDPDMVPTVMIESGSSSQTIINNLSYRQMVQYGKGMTYAAATSTINTPNGVQSRDIQGTPSSTWPYVARYKDQYTGDGIYDDVKGTADDKAYTIVYEPSTSIPYQRLSIQIFNGSPLGARQLSRLEVRRVIYIDPEKSDNPGSTVGLADMSRFTAAINQLGKNAHVQIPPAFGQIAESNYAKSYSTTTSSQSQPQANNILEQLYDDFIKFLYHKRFGEKNKVVMENPETVAIATINEQKQLQKMMDMIDNKTVDPEGDKNLMERNKSSSDVMQVSWE